METGTRRARAYATRGILLLVRKQRVHRVTLRIWPPTIIFDLCMLGLKRVLVLRLE